MTTTQQPPSITLTAEARNERGSTTSNRLRRAGWLPGVVYNSAGKSQALKMQLHHLELLIQQHGRQNLILDLNLDGAGARKVILRDLQRDFASDRITHVDFMEISLTRKIRVEVAIRLVGEPTGVSQQGGVLEHLLREITVECLPMDIVREVTIDVTSMELGDSRFVRDIPLDPKITVLTSPGIAVATVQAPQVEEEKPTEETPEDAAPAAEGEKKSAEADGDAGKDSAAEKAEDKAEKGDKSDKSRK